MTIQQPIRPAIAIVADSAPFSPEQRARLNALFGGLLFIEGLPNAPAGSAPPGASANDDGAPWHDAAMPIADRMKLAEGLTVPRRLFAAMAQQDCGQCGYLCESYATALVKGEEKRQNLCVPGGKETSRMLKQLLEVNGAAAQAPASVTHTTAKTETQKTAIPAAAGYTRDQPVDAVFKEAVLITGASSQKDTRHIVIDIANSGIDFVPGDSFGLFPRNHPALADAVIAAMRAPADFPIAGKSLRDTLIEDYSLGAAPDMLFELVSYMVGGERRLKAKQLAKGGDPDGDAETLDVLAVLEKFPGVHPDPEAFLECLEPLQPRLYSISSSPLATPGEVHLTVDAVRYKIGERDRFGVGSTFLVDRLTPGSTLKSYVQKAHGFALPPDPKMPVIMVGPGTGIAPFRSFLWHRKATRATGRAWLFFGHQHEACDFFYREEMEAFKADGTLTRLSTAWSRDGAQKVYVQDRMREAGPELWSWLKAGAHFYVCGDAKRMAKDVEAAIVEIAAKAGSMSDAGAKDFLAELKETGRYQADVY